MILKEEKRDLFALPDDYYFIHCISGDLGNGRGLEIEFNTRLDLRNNLRDNWRHRLEDYFSINGFSPQCILESRVLTLIPMEKYWNPIKYDALRIAFYHMKHTMEREHISKAALLKSEFDSNNLEWDKVKEIIEDIFKDTTVEILVCYL